MSSRAETRRSHVIRVEVRLVGVLRGLLGEQKLILAVEEPAVVRGVVKEVSTKLGRRAKPPLFVPGSEDPRSSILVLVNDADVNLMQGLDTLLSDGDVVTLIPLYHGG
jgi:molybdopterin converting factor small subunit